MCLNIVRDLGFFKHSSGLDSVATSVDLSLLTELESEVVMSPTIGCGTVNCGDFSITFRVSRKNLKGRDKQETLSQTRSKVKTGT